MMIYDVKVPHGDRIPGLLLRMPLLRNMQMNIPLGALNESVPHIICSPEESCWLAKIQVFRLAGWEILLLIEVLPGNY